jgi:hypothetical protein
VYEAAPSQPIKLTGTWISDDQMDSSQLDGLRSCRLEKNALFRRQRPMEREELRLLLRREPFEPFRVYLTDGRTHDVLYPNMHILGQIHMTIGFPEPNVADPYCDHTVSVMLSDIARAEIVPALIEYRRLLALS